MLERRICAAILERLEKDTNNDVNTLAVKALNVLVKKTSQAQVTEVCDRVAQHLLTGREDLR
jgi:cytidylate kinase